MTSKDYEIAALERQRKALYDTAKACVDHMAHGRNASDARLAYKALTLSLLSGQFVKPEART